MSSKMLRFDHVNILTGNLKQMTAWYCDVLGLVKGWRPPFGNDGAWLYLGDQAIVHLVGEPKTPQTTDPRLEHFALKASGYKAFITKLHAMGIAYQENFIPGTDLVQVNIFDPDGTHIHIDFDLSKETDETAL